MPSVPGSWAFAKFAASSRVPFLWVIAELRSALAQSSGPNSWGTSLTGRGPLSAFIAQHWFAVDRTAEPRPVHPGKEGLRLLSGTGHLSLPLAALPFVGRGSLEDPRVLWNYLPIQIPEGKSPEVCGSHRAF